MSPIQQTLAVLGEHGYIPDGIIHVQSHEPTEQEVVVELLHEHSFATHREERLQQKRSQQLLWRNRGPSSSRVQLIEARLQPLQRVVGQGT
jgi:hypothetical protein